MKTSIQLSLVLLIFSLCSAFTNLKNDGLNVTYGVSKSDPSQIELKLNADYTFTYQDFSNTAQKIAVNGTYQIKNHQIQLISKDKEINYHNKWKISNDHKTAKSRKGLSFYTLHIK
tara:strand:+ start:591 stop:938 length:348 start_codon:yes stop_codon:yes gene_type:complete